MKKYLFILLFGLSCFMYGMYTIGNVRPVKPFQWVITGMFVDEFKKDGK